MSESKSSQGTASKHRHVAQAACQRRLTQNGMDNSHRLMLLRMLVDIHTMERALQLRLMREENYLYLQDALVKLLTLESLIKV